MIFGFNRSFPHFVNRCSGMAPYQIAVTILINVFIDIVTAIRQGCPSEHSYIPTVINIVQNKLSKYFFFNVKLKLCTLAQCSTRRRRGLLDGRQSYKPEPREPRLSLSTVPDFSPGNQQEARDAGIQCCKLSQNASANVRIHPWAQ